MFTIWLYHRVFIADPKSTIFAHVLDQVHFYSYEKNMNIIWYIKQTEQCFFFRNNTFSPEVISANVNF